MLSRPVDLGVSSFSSSFCIVCCNVKGAGVAGKGCVCVACRVSGYDGCVPVC